MKLARFLFLIIGIALLAAIIANTDLNEAMDLVGEMSWGITIVLGLFFVAFLGDVLAWQLTLPRSIGMTWFGRLWIVRIVGEAFNYTIPAGGMGGEPVKAVLLKRYFGIDYDGAIASLVMVKTINLIALIAFLSIGFALMQFSSVIEDTYRNVAGIGLVVLITAISAFFVVQRFGLLSTSATLFNRPGNRPWADIAITKIQVVESRFKEFYDGNSAKFIAALTVAFLVWCVGVAEIYATLYLLGYPVSVSQAWMIEAAAQLIRSGTFFIPASIGAQEGIFVVMCGVFTGAPVSGFATALVRRIREIIWVAAGFAFGAALPKIWRPVSSS
ncbi:MAG: flippase-like domain-containing protein [Alphaproteobacteria bacterium]|nr:flippase-like domain-containing protein [Alphaproteobacteria bacterium]